MTENLRHSCFAGKEFRPDGIPRNASGWVQLGAYGAVTVWEEDGLERVAQWSNTAGLHLYTEGMHKSCLRIVVPWAKAKAIVDTIKRGNMEARMKKTEEIVDQLVAHVERGFAVIVVGVHGSGKNWLCEMAIEKMGRVPHTVNLSILDMDALTGFSLPVRVGACMTVTKTPSFFDKLPENAGLIFDELHNANSMLLKQIGAAICQYVRGDGRPSPNKKRVVFITLPPHIDANALLEKFGPATGETLGLERLVVEITK